MNYKSGDLVKITGNCTGHWFKIGETVRLKCKRSDGREWKAEYLDGHDFWYVKESDMKPFKPAIMPQKIVITTDGKTTLARLFSGKKMVKRAEAKCAPSDTFDFGVGTELAVKRLMGDNPVTEPVKESKPKPVKLYCVKSIYRNFKFLKGKTYNATEDFQITDENGKTTPCRYRSIAEHDKGNPGYANSLFPLVRRPAKVGEWVLPLADSPFGRYKGSQLLKVTKDLSNDPDSVFYNKGVVCEHPDCNAYVIRNEEYLVLDGYHGDLE